jgi:membrane-associated phospholipid phosphatase
MHALGLAPHIVASLSWNDRWYLDVNRFARQTSAMHGFMAAYAHLGGIGLLALCLLAAWWAARMETAPQRAVAFVLWAGIGTVIIWAIAHFGIKPLVGEKRPYLVLAHVEVLRPRTHGYSFPSGHATIAGAVMAGLFLARRWLIAILASVAGLFLCFARVYAGMHYPGDVIGGLLIGGAFMVIFALPAVALLERFDDYLLDHTPLAPFVSDSVSWKLLLPSRWSRDWLSDGSLAFPSGGPHHVSSEDPSMRTRGAEETSEGVSVAGTSNADPYGNGAVRVLPRKNLGSNQGDPRPSRRREDQPAQDNEVEHGQ